MYVSMLIWLLMGSEKLFESKLCVRIAILIYSRLKYEFVTD